MSDTRIKPMETDAETEGKAYVHWRSWQEAYAGIVDPAYLAALTLEKCRKIARRWPDRILVAKDGERVVGFVGYGPYRDGSLPDAGEVIAIYVLKDYYGTGLGRRLMDAALEKLKEFSRAALWVLEDNKRAIRFYEKRGFQPDGARQTLKLGTEIAEIRMVLDRPPIGSSGTASICSCIFEPDGV